MAWQSPLVNAEPVWQNRYKFKYGVVYNQRVYELLRKPMPSNLLSQEKFMEEINNTLAPLEKCRGRIIPKDIHEELKVPDLSCCPLLTANAKTEPRPEINLMATRLAHMLLKYRKPIEISELGNLYKTEFPALPSKASHELLGYLANYANYFPRDKTTITSIYALNDVKVERLIDELGPLGLCIHCLPSLGINNYDGVLFSPFSTQNYICILDTPLLASATNTDSVVLFWFLTVSQICQSRKYGKPAEVFSMVLKDVLEMPLPAAKVSEIEEAYLFELCLKMFSDPSCEGSLFQKVLGVCPHIRFSLFATVPRISSLYERISGPLECYINTEMLIKRVASIEDHLLKILEGQTMPEIEMERIIKVFKKNKDDILIDYNIWKYMKQIKVKDVKGKKFLCLPLTLKTSSLETSTQKTKMKKEVEATGRKQLEDTSNLKCLSTADAVKKLESYRLLPKHLENAKLFEEFFDFSYLLVDGSFQQYALHISMFLTKCLENQNPVLRNFFLTVREVPLEQGSSSNLFALFEQFIVRAGILCLRDVPTLAGLAKAVDVLCTRVYWIMAGSGKSFTITEIRQYYFDFFPFNPSFPDSMKNLWSVLKNFPNHFAQVGTDKVRAKSPYMDAMLDFVKTHAGVAISQSFANPIYEEVTGKSILQCLNFYPRYKSTFHGIDVSTKQLDSMMFECVVPSLFVRCFINSEINFDRQTNHLYRNSYRADFDRFNDYTKFVLSMPSNNYIDKTTIYFMSKTMEISETTLDWILTESEAKVLGEYVFFNDTFESMLPMFKKLPLGLILDRPTLKSLEHNESLIEYASHRCGVLARLRLPQEKVSTIISNIEEILEDAAVIPLDDLVEIYVAKHKCRPFLPNEWKLLAKDSKKFNFYDKCGKLLIELKHRKKAMETVASEVAERMSRNTVKEKVNAPIVTNEPAEEKSPKMFDAPLGDEQVTQNIFYILKQHKTVSLGRLAAIYKEKFNSKIPTGKLKLNKFLRKIPWLEVKEEPGSGDMTVSMMPEPEAETKKDIVEKKKEMNAKRRNRSESRDARFLKNLQLVQDTLKIYPDGVAVSLFLKVYRRNNSHRLIHQLDSLEAYLRSLDTVEVITSHGSKIVRLIEAPKCALTFEKFEENVLNILTSNELDYVSFCDLYKITYKDFIPASRCYGAQDLVELFHMSTKVLSKATGSSNFISISLPRKNNQIRSQMEIFVANLLRDSKQTLTLNQLKEEYFNHMKTLDDSLDFQDFFTKSSKIEHFVEDAEEYVRLKDSKVRPCDSILNKLIKACADAKSKPARTLVSNVNVQISKYGFNDPIDFLTFLDDIFTVNNSNVSIRSRFLPDCLREDLLKVIKSIRGDLNVSDFDERFQQVCGFILRPKALGFNSWRDLLQAELSGFCAISASGFVRPQRSIKPSRMPAKPKPEAPRKSSLSTPGIETDSIEREETTDISDCLDDCTLYNIKTVLVAAERIGYPDDLFETYEQTFDVQLQCSDVNKLLVTLLQKIAMNVISDGEGNIIIIALPEELLKATPNSDGLISGGEMQNYDNYYGLDDEVGYGDDNDEEMSACYDALLSSLFEEYHVPVTVDIQAIRKTDIRSICAIVDRML